ncbi:MAG: TlpA family protein disulfide reductase, partial [Holophaga sp.]|nr:TlpA family protein disulfide reductase [Holophaga sp.]
MKFRPLPLRLMTAVSLVWLAVPCPAQSPRTKLGFGDPAPALQVKWLKGEPIAKFDNDKIYVVEFWATWCGPCRAVMPHLSELARTLAGKVEIIGVDVLEGQKDGKPYSSFLPKVKAFVNQMGDNMAYHVAMDDDNLSMARNWMDASQQQGIPATFVVQGGRIIFIGHPRKLDQVLPAVLAGTYDMAAARQEYEKEYQATYGPMILLKEITKDVDAAMAVKDYAKALRLVEAQRSTAPASLVPALDSMKLKALLHSDPAQALAFAKERTAANPIFAYSVASSIEAEDGLSPEAYLHAAAIYQDLQKPNGTASPSLHQSIATCYAKAKNFAKAAAAEEKAIALA